jgi:thiosulfate/3-mercaptopyruvate sulfurtransferase
MAADSPLIAPEALAERLHDRRLRLLDVRWWLTEPGRGHRDYLAGHVPGALWVDLDTTLTAPTGPGRHPLPDPAAFRARMLELGVTDHVDVVVYDDVGGTIAARLWWMLETLGHPSTRVLDGGFAAWRSAGLPVTAEIPVASPSVGPLTLAGHWSRTVDREALHARLGTLALVDVRAHERYRGDTEPVDPVAGHIPTAVNLPLPGNLGADGRFLEPDELRARYAPLGGEVVVACGSGVNACHAALAMRIAGLPDPMLYEGSYSDWSRSGMPVATGDAPGSMPG